MSSAEPFGSGRPLVADTSAWLRRHSVPERWRATVEAGVIAACAPVSLELLATAKNEAAFADLDRALSALPQAPVTRAACDAALAAARGLGGERRLPAIDYLIAAAASERGFDVLHYDKHFDTLAGVLACESVWIAPRGTLD